MRYQGKIKTWNHAKGFGFIAPNGGGEDVFVNIKEFANRRRKPIASSLITYEIKLDEKKRKQAVDVQFVDEKINKAPVTSPLNNLLTKVWSLFTFGVIGYLIVCLYQNRGSTIDATFYKTLYLNGTDYSEFKCKSKTHCSEMNSCVEAMFYQENCSSTQMDGNRDGIPCEQQWCN